MRFIDPDGMDAGQYGVPSWVSSSLTGEDGSTTITFSGTATLEEDKGESFFYGLFIGSGNWPSDGLDWFFSDLDPNVSAFSNRRETFCNHWLERKNRRD